MNPMKGEPKSLAQQYPLAEVLSHLTDSSLTISNSELGELSDLNTQEAKQFETVWEQIDTQRKQQILSRLQELTEDNFELNFDRIYRNAIYDTDDKVRREAIEGMWENCDPSLVRPLLRLVQQDPVTEVRSAAANALGRFSLLVEQQKIPLENRVHISRALLAVIHNPGEPIELRRRALEAVAPLSLPEVTQAIWQAYRREAPGLRISSVYAMGRNCDMLWMPTILKEMDNDDPEMRYEAATAAGQLGEAEAIPRLIELTHDSDMEVKLAAIQALGKIGGQEAKQTLRVALASKSQAVHDAAEHGLAEMDQYEQPIIQRPDESDDTDTD
jgi:HEAT repeat protein